ncbi:substrate-binding domain-containing protein [Mobilitalea sibirica]|uniref:Substrate-binding domain-containing protein n=1 Tax=Mobilitalea sibirica TaxID=1462919 RepID=A0A8J7H083_9FIRM|nr:substrate-binding domain-containing protein [Mobilitalea sibirica]MBH1939388.1 substrate-binding domain-containing protein [Mobilitalea sibirica]
MSEQQNSKVKNRNNTRFLILTLAFLILVLMVALSLLFLSDREGVKDYIQYGFIVIIVLFALELILLLRFFASITLVDKNANLLSQGKLNISDINADKTKGLESLTIAFNEMKRNLLSFIESTKSNVIILSDAVDKVTKSLDMSYKGNEQIASNMNIVAEKAQDQLKIVKDTLDRIQEVSQRTNSITTSLANIEGFVENTVNMAENGSEHLDKYNEQMDVISTNLSDTSTFIDTLNSHLKEIDQVGGLIINITEQLKLLSLNSAVEAARAGEAGKGFVVVAQEMNKLSSQTRDSIGQINKLLSNILNSNEKVSESIDSCVESFNISKEIFNSVKDSFYTINKNANILNEDMKKVYEESRLINENTKGINEKGLILHDASNEISSITQDVAAVTEEELAENEEINNQALSLQNMLSSIENLLMRFKTSIVPVDQVSPKRLKIVMLSPLDHPFWHGVRQGALYAKNELKTKNVEVEYIGFEHVDDRFNQTLAERIKEGCDGIVVPGFIQDIENHVANANRKNIPVMAFNCDFVEGTKRLSYFGPDIHAAGLMAGELVVKALDGEGEYALIRGGLGTSINKIRRDALIEVTKKKKKIKLVEEIEAEINDNIVYKKTKESLMKYPNLRALVVVTGGITGAAKAIEELGRIGKTVLICFDYDQKVMELIKQGICYAAMGQDPFGQGHDPIISLYNYIMANETPDSISYTRTEVIDIRSITES